MKFLNSKIQILVYVLVFLGAAAITFFTRGGTSSYKEPKPTTMEEAKLPYAYMTSPKGTNYNYLHGYTCDMDIGKMHEPITPISSNRTIQINIKKYGCPVKKVDYELRSLDGKTLIERNSVDGMENNEDILTVTTKFRDLMDAGREYMLKLNVDTDTYGVASYYTRVVIMDDAYIDKKLNYIKNFSSYTLDDDKLDRITSQLETDSTGDNTNLGRVNIHSKMSQIGYAEMEPALTSDKYITVNEIDGDVASVSLNYKVRTDDVNGVFDYNIKEYIRIYQPDDTLTYVHSYDRWMEQDFDAQSSVSSLGDLYFGISAGKDIEKATNSNGKFTAFVRNNELWEFYTTKNEMASIFTFMDRDGDNVRGNYNQHDIKILEVDDEGNIKFLVYGYMNRGAHEGKVGISVFEYNRESRKTSELIFIPRDDPYMCIAMDINTLSYINEDGVLFIYSDKSIYYIDCETKECMVVAGDIIPSSCIRSEDRNILVYQTGQDVYSSTKVYVLIMSTGETFEIDADEGSYIRALGYLDGNIVYGQAKADMVAVNAEGNVDFPMYDVIMMNSEKEIVKEYNTKNIYATGVEISGSKMVIDRAKYDKKGNLVPMSADVILCNSENNQNLVRLTTRATESRQTEYYLKLIAGGITGHTTVHETNYMYMPDTTVTIVTSEDNKADRYYAYSFGELALITENLANALEVASNGGGVVVDSTSTMIWSRYKSKEHTISISQSMIATSKNTKLAATNLLLKYQGINTSAASLYKKGFTIIQCLDNLCGKTINLTGNKVEQVLYFVDRNYPIIAKTGANNYEVLYGYDKNYVITIDMSDGVTKSYTYAEFNEAIEAYGNVIITAQK